MKSTKFLYFLLGLLVLANVSCTQDDIVAENYISFDTVNSNIEVAASGSGEGIVTVFSSFVAPNDITIGVSVLDTNLEDTQYSVPANVVIPAGTNKGELSIQFSNVNLSAATSITLAFDEAPGFVYGSNATYTLAEECPDTDIFILITFDDYSDETSWEIFSQGNPNPVLSNSYSGGMTSTNERYCLPSGEYLFIIYDDFGDGICCDWGQGSYNVILGDGTVVASGGEFGSSESSTFTID